MGCSGEFLAPEMGLVIPAYNEEARITPALNDALSVLDREFGHNYEVIVADDGSVDRTPEIAASYGATVLQLPHHGKGAAIKAAMLTSTAKYRAFMDADGSFATDDVLHLVEDVMGEDDIAIAVREGGVHTVGPHESRCRALGSSLMASICERIAPTGIRDTQCGAKAFKGSVAEVLFGESVIDGFAADREILYLAHRAGYKVVERTCQVVPMPGSKVRPLQDGLRLMSDAIRIRAKH